MTTFVSDEDSPHHLLISDSIIIINHKIQPLKPQFTVIIVKFNCHKISLKPSH